MKRLVHGLAGIFALLTILLFISATLYVEWFGSEWAVLRVKKAIAFPGIEVLVVLLMLTGGTGRSLAKGRSDPIVRTKVRRMRIAAFNGVVILIPSALLLAYWAQAGNFTVAFYIVQLFEIFFGLFNLGVLILNIKDGFSLRSGRRATGGGRSSDQATGRILEEAGVGGRNES